MLPNVLRMSQRRLRSRSCCPVSDGKDSACKGWTAHLALCKEALLFRYPLHGRWHGTHVLQHSWTTLCHRGGR